MPEASPRPESRSSQSLSIGRERLPRKRSQVLAELVDRARAAPQETLEADQRAAAIRHIGQKFAQKCHVHAGSQFAG